MQLTSRDDPEHGSDGRRVGGGDHAVCPPAASAGAALTYRRIFHPNIVLCLGTCPVPGHFMIVVERLLFSLEPVIHENPLGKTVVSMQQRLTWVREASLGMNWLHGICKIVHRGLKPANLILDENLHIKATDFGFGEYLRKQAGLKDMTAPKGTVVYMAPEVMKQKGFNEKAVVFCFGLIIFEVLTDEEPYAQFNDTLWQQLRKRPVEEGDGLMLFDTVKEVDGRICVDVCGLGRCLFARDDIAKDRWMGLELLFTIATSTRPFEVPLLHHHDGLRPQIDCYALFVLIGPF